MARRTAKQTAAATAFVGEAQRILDRARVAGEVTVIDIYTRELAIRKSIIAQEGY